jgi:hypothetical protein
VPGEPAPLIVTV